MAISGGDGSIILTTKVDTSGINAGSNKIKGIAEKIKDSFKSVGVQISNSFSRNKEIVKLQERLDKTNKIIDETKLKMEDLAKRADAISASAFQGPEGELTYTDADEKEIAKIDAEYMKLGETLEKNEIKARELGDAIKSSSKGNIPAVDAVSKGMGKLGKRIAMLVNRVFIFSVILKALRALLNLIKNVAMGDDDFVKSLNELKAALWVAFTPILNVVIPALKTLMNWLTQVAIAVGKFFATISGKSYNSLIDQAKGFQNMAKGAKDAKKQLAGFDELQILQGNKEEQGISEDLFENLKTPEGEHTPSFAEQFSAIIAGVGLLIAALGLVLLFKTVSPLAHSIGIGMIIAGAGIFAVGAVQMVANNMGEDIGNMLHGIIAIVSGFALAIGIILLFMGQITPLSIGLVVAGAVGLASEVALYPESVKEALQGWVGGILAIISGALLVIGIVLCVCGIVTPLSIGMIVVGAVGLVAVVAINWNFIVDKTKEIFQKFGGIIAAAGVALIVLGIILCCTGVGIGLGIGLILAGAAGLAGAVAFNWDAIVNWVKGAWEAVKGFWNRYIAPIFTAKFWLDLAKTCGNGLISGFEGAVNAIITLFEKMINWIVNGLNKISFNIPDWLGGGKFGINLKNVNLGRLSIPRLAQGTVIPPNREFLAVLGDQKHGTNIEAPLDTIVEAFKIAQANNPQEPTNVNIKFTGSLAELARVLKPAIELEAKRDSVFA